MKDHPVLRHYNYLDVFERALRQAGLGPEARLVADIGCGPGHWTVAAARVAPAARVVGVDPDTDFLEMARHWRDKLGAANAEFVEADFLAWGRGQPAGAMDAVMANGFMMYVDRDAAMACFARLLRPGGLLILYHNHGAGYYLRRAGRALRQGRPRDLWYFTMGPLLLNNLRRLRGAHQGETFLPPAYLRGLAARHGIELTPLPDQPMIGYRPATLGLAEVTSWAGRRLGREDGA